MSEESLKCIIILSAKSSGSSVCQRYLSGFAEINHIRKVRHFVNETLYWVKATSVLGYPQEDILDSEVPIPKEKAENDLLELFSDNLGRTDINIDNEEGIFQGWKLLCEEFKPVFLEKSPHHLHQWSAIKLIKGCMEQKPEIDFYLFGLVRNPMDTLYSVYKRWKTPPEKAQYEWLTAYKNLLQLKEMVGDKLFIARYEDIVKDASLLDPLLDFAGVDSSNRSSTTFHKQSLSKWKKDSSYGFVLTDSVKKIAKEYGYKDEELDNKSYPFWPIRRILSRKAYKTKVFLKNILKNSPVGSLLVRLKRKVRGLV